MPYAETVSELRSLTDDQLIEKHDLCAEHTVIGTNHYLQEIYRRDQAQIGQKMLYLTRAMAWMALVVTIATLVNVAILILQVFQLD